MELFYSFRKHLEKAKEFNCLSDKITATLSTKEQLKNLIEDLLNTSQTISEPQLADSLNSFLDIMILCLERENNQQQLDYVKAESEKLKLIKENKQQLLLGVKQLLQWLADHSKQIIIDNLWEDKLGQHKDLFIDELAKYNKRVTDLMASQANSMEWQRLGVILMNFVMASMKIKYIPNPHEDAELKRYSSQTKGMPFVAL